MLGVRIPNDLYEKIREAARQGERNVSQFVRLILTAHLKIEGKKVR